MAKKQMNEQQNQLSAEEKYKRNKRIGIIAIIAALFGVGAVVAMLVVNGINSDMNNNNVVTLACVGLYDLVAMVVGVYMLATAKKKYQKQLAEEQRAAELLEDEIAQEANAQAESGQVSGAHTSTAPQMDLSMSEAGDKLTEAHGADLNEIMQNPQGVEKLTFRSESGELLTYDFLWGNVYGGVTYLVVGRMEDVYTKYIIFISPEDPTVCYCELNDGVRGVIKNDFERALSAYTQANGIQAEKKTESGGRLASLKRRFVSDKPDTRKKYTFVVMLVLYGAILVGGLSSFLTSLSGGANESLIKAISLAYMLITPSFFIYFGSHNPFDFKNGVCYALIALGIAGMIGATVAGFIIINNFGETSDAVLNFIIKTAVPISLIVATVCYIIAYVVWCRGLSSKWFLGIGIATTLLFPVATALIIAAVALYLAYLLISWLISALIILFGGTPMGRGFKEGWTGQSQGGAVYELTDENGYTHTLRQYDGNRYYDGHDFWISDDGGNTFRRES